MKIKDLFFNYINDKYEKKFIKLLLSRLRTDNIEDPLFIIEEIQSKAPLVYESYVKNNRPKEKSENMHIRIATFFLVAYSSLRIKYKEKEDLIIILKEISSYVFYNDIKFFFKLCFLFSKNKLIAIWNYFLLFQKFFIDSFFLDNLKLSKDYHNGKISISINPIIYIDYFSKHKSEYLISPSVSYLDAIIKVIEDNYKDLNIEKCEITNIINYFIYYKP